MGDPNPNKAYINDNNQVDITYHGEQTAEWVEETNKETLRLADQLRAESKPVLILINVSDIPATDSASRRVGSEYLEKINFDKLAIYGSNSFIRTVVNLVILASPKANTVKLFSKREDAEQWLTA